MLSPPQVEEVRGPAVEALAPAWAALAARDPRATPFQRPEWLLPYCRAFGVREPWAVVVRRGERLAALAPLVVFDEGGRRVATLLGGGRSDWQDALVDPALAPDGARLLLERIAARAEGLDALLLERLPADGWLAGAAVPAGLRLARAEADEPCPVVALPDRVEGLAARAAPHVLENARYGRRRLAREGAVEVVEAIGPAGVARHLEAFFALHRARWAARGRAGVLEEAAVRRFHAAAARALAGAGLLRGYRLVVGGHDVAVWHGLAAGDRWFYYLGGFDPAYGRASPGAVLLLHALEEAVRAGARSLDLLRGREAYKYAWGAVDRAAVRRLLAPARATGEVAVDAG